MWNRHKMYQKQSVQKESPREKLVFHDLYTSRFWHYNHRTVAQSQPQKITERDQGFFRKIKKKAWNQKLGYILEFENHNSSLLTITYRNNTWKVKIQKEKRTVKLAAKKEKYIIGKDPHAEKD